MRFLQSEWLRHERDRNAWEIEHAEMKSRISKLEGDRRTAQRLQNSLQKHVKMLENVLKTEREKAEKLQNGEDPTESSEKGEGGKSSKGKLYLLGVLLPANPKDSTFTGYQIGEAGESLQTSRSPARYRKRQIQAFPGQMSARGNVLYHSERRRAAGHCRRRAIIAESLSRSRVSAFYG